MKRVPSLIHRAAIESALTTTFLNRRERIIKDSPSVTEI